MKTYSITEAIDHFSTPNEVAFVFKGRAKGTFMVIDEMNDNRIASLYPDGTHSYGLYIKANFEITKEESREIIFLHELLEEDTDEVADVLSFLYTSMDAGLRRFIEIYKNLKNNS